MPSKALFSVFLFLFFDAYHVGLAGFYALQHGMEAGPLRAGAPICCSFLLSRSYRLFLFRQYRLLPKSALTSAKPPALGFPKGRRFFVVRGCFRPLLRGAYASRSLRLSTKAAARSAVGRATTHTSTPLSPVAGLSVPGSAGSVLPGSLGSVLPGSSGFTGVG